MDAYSCSFNDKNQAPYGEELIRDCILFEMDDLPVKTCTLNWVSLHTPGISGEADDCWACACNLTSMDFCSSSFGIDGFAGNVPNDRSVRAFFPTLSFDFSAGDITALEAFNQRTDHMVSATNDETAQQENGRAKESVCARSPPSIVSSQIGIGALPDNSSSPSPVTAVVDRNRGNGVSTKLDGVHGSRKVPIVRKLDREYGISREVLEQYSEKKLQDVADIFGVSRSTMKRICRKYHIFRWPPCKVKKFRPYINSQVFNQAKCRMRNETERQENNCSMMVKATYRDDIIKFRLSLSSRKQDLEEEVAMRLNLSIGSFKIKYLDEDEEWVLVACDADLGMCMSTLRSLGRTTIRMLVGKLPG